jgi:L-aspartate oxidase
MLTDVLVIGSGIAGMSYAIKLSELNPELRIVILSKRNLLESNTKYAQGGIAVVQNFQKDSFDKHIADTLKAGDGLCDKEVVSFVVKEGPDRLEELLNWGTEFDQEGEGFHLGKEGGHTAKRIVHYKDKSGHQIQESLIAKIKSLSNISILENHTLVNLITDHQLEEGFQRRCYGAYVISSKDQRIVKIVAGLTVLSTGGAGAVYNKTTNPDSATGDGIAAAYRAKVTITNLQYVQFHPTALVLPYNNKTFLISEAVRGAGAHLKNSKGERFVFKHDKRGELASRDIVARAIEIELKELGEKEVYLDCSPIGEKGFKEEFPTIYSACKELNIDPFKEGIPVLPAAHYFCGGIDVDQNSQTSLSHLYAIGECSHTGLHGANRLASNSLLEALVFAHRAAVHSSEYYKNNTLDLIEEQIPNWKDTDIIKDQESKVIARLKSSLQELMSQQVGIFKSNQSLQKAERDLEKVYLATKDIYENKKLTHQICELRNLVNVAYLIIKQSQNCHQNRGGFYNIDYENL